MQLGSEPSDLCMVDEIEAKRGGYRYKTGKGGLKRINIWWAFGHSLP